MSYTYTETVSAQPRSVYDFHSTNEEVLGETFAEAFETNPVTGALFGRGPAADIVNLHRAQQTGQKLTAQEARDQLAKEGLSSHLKVDETGITQPALDMLMDRKKAELRRQEILSLAEGGFAQGAQNFGVSIFTMFADPLNVAAGFLPVIGEERYLAMLGRASGMLARTGIRVGVGAAEGIVGNAPLEALNYASKQYQQADYNAADSLTNLLTGAVFGSVLHGVTGGAAEGVRNLLGNEQPWDRTAGLSAGDIKLVRNLQEQIRAGADDWSVKTALSTWTPEMRRAIDEDLPLRLRSDSDRVRATDLAKPTQDAINVELVAALRDGRLPYIDGILRTEIGETPDGTSTLHLTPERFTPELVAAKLDDLAASVERRLAEAEQAPTINPVEIAKLREERAAVEGASRERSMNPEDARWLKQEAEANVAAAGREPNIRPGQAYTAPRHGEPVIHAEALRRAAVAHAVEQGAVVPHLALDGASAATRAQAEGIRQSVTLREFIEKANREIKADPADRELIETANQQADELTATAPKEGAEVEAAVAEEAQAEAMLKTVSDRVSAIDDDPEFAQLEEGAQRAERWIRTAELATTCLLNGID